jgi:hypothetical protein
MTGSDGVNSMLPLKRGGDGTKHYKKMKQHQRTHLSYIGSKRDTARQRDDVSRRRSNTGEGKGRRWCQLGWRESYWAKTWRKFTRSIQLLQMNGEDLKQQWVTLIFFKTHVSGILFCSSHRVEHNGDNRILNGYYMSAINHFKFWYYAK